MIVMMALAKHDNYYDHDDGDDDCDNDDDDNGGNSVEQYLLFQLLYCPSNEYNMF